MNIGIDIRPLMSSVRTGVGEYTHELVSAIFKLDKPPQMRGKQNQYFLFYNSYGDVSKNIPQWKQDNVRYVSTRWPNKLFNASIKFLGGPKLDKTIIENCKLKIENCDWFFSPNPNFTALSKQTKLILTVHDLSFEFYPEFFSRKQRLWHKMVNPKKQCRRADLILTPSENTKRDIVDFYNINPEKIKVIYPGINCHAELVSASPETPEEILKEIPKQVRDDIKSRYNLPEKFILFLGTVELRKNVIGIIKAFENCRSSLPHPYSLVIAGAPGCGYKQILARQQKSPIRDTIKFIGYVAAEDKPALYSLADLFVYPSFYEGFGFPVLEAMACGAPIITSNRSSLPEITGNSAYLINPNNTADISNAIIRLAKSEELRNFFRNKGFKQAKKFSWESAAKNFLNAINLYE